MTPICDLLLTMSTFRSERRAQIVATVEGAPADLVYRPATIAGGVGDGSIYAAFAHVIDVEHMWLHQYALAEGARAKADPSVQRGLDDLANAWARISDEWEALIRNRTEDELQLHLAFADGTSVPTWLVVLHAYNHTTHHVSEIWTALTAAGVQPPELSLMQWARAHDWSFAMTNDATGEA